MEQIETMWYNGVLLAERKMKDMNTAFIKLILSMLSCGMSRVIKVITG